MKVSDAWTMFFYLSVGLVVGLATSLATRRTDAAQLDRFFLLLRTPVRDGEVVHEPCTLPDDPEEPIAKLINHPDWEIPRPNVVDIAGFVAAWVLVAAIIYGTWWLSRAA